MEQSVGISRTINQCIPPRSVFLRLILHGMFVRFRHWRRNRRAERELLALDDRLLKDIGVCRTEVPDAVRGQVQTLYTLASDQQL
jgi:uncharacterized protein YjiS (DUF1127 family)